ncbi:hypothetical protein GCM10022221_16220 [Actinocorallia aurea]
MDLIGDPPARKGAITMSQNLMPCLAAPVERTVTGAAAHDAEGASQSNQWYTYTTFAGQDDE